jgi:hypothetical protein
MTIRKGQNFAMLKDCFDGNIIAIPTISITTIRHPAKNPLSYKCHLFPWHVNQQPELIPKILSQ